VLKTFTSRRASDNQGRVEGDDELSEQSITERFLSMTSKWFFASAAALLITVGAAAAKWEDHVNPHNLPLTAAQGLGVVGAAGLTAAGVRKTLLEENERGLITRKVTLLSAADSPTKKSCEICYTAQVGDPEEYRHGYSFAHPGNKLGKLDERLRDEVKPSTGIFPLRRETGNSHPAIDFLTSLGQHFKRYETEEPKVRILSYAISDGDSRLTVVLRDPTLVPSQPERATSEKVTRVKV